MNLNARLARADKFFSNGDKERAFKLYLQAAESGDERAITQVGLMYYNGIGTAVDCDAAFRWLNRGLGFLLRNAPATYTLAEMFFHGRGTEQNYSRALNLYELACNGGHNFNAVFRLGEMYEYGCGVEVDNERAVEYYKTAADFGNDVAMSKLGLIYETGEFVAQDFREAKHWYSMAASHGNKFAAARLAELED